MRFNRLTRPFIAVTAALALLLTSVTPAAANGRVDRQTNRFRVNHGEHRLKRDQGGPLWRLARRRTHQIDNRFAHRYDWQWFFDRLPSCARGIGENIAYYTTGYEPRRWPFRAWKHSAPHRRNMLGNWTWMASAIRKDTDGRTYAVQLFLKGCGHRDWGRHY